MSRDSVRPVFLERATYRQRRLRDAARLLPLLGLVLWLIPLLWRKGVQGGSAQAILYIFGVWLLLIGLAAFISHRIRPEQPPDDRDTAS